MNPMNSDRIFEAAIRASKNLLWQNLQSTNDLPDAATVIRLRELVHSPSIRSALLYSSDTLLAFALRAVEEMLERVRRAQLANLAPSRRKQGFESPRERQ